ncbi:MAG: hypothetical protein JEZ09_05175 [Salinivirgaceae bacterium]|nr:hypothetical protein [Salinivirgaceae bacterium]
MRKNIFFVFILFVTFLIISCAPNKKAEVKEKHLETEMQVEINENEVSFNPDNYQAEDIVFYNLFSPVDLTYLVSKQNAFYNSYLINPINNITKYTESSKIALNLGVYGADISYLWMFDQSQQSLSYRSAIQRLTDKLEIPRDFVDFTYLQAENYQEQFDSLVFVARHSYTTADNYLKEADREHSAALILLGGWIETLYIATHMFENPDKKLLSRIAIQKYSLSSLYNILQKYQDDNDVAEYLLLLKKLKKTYDELEVQFEAESLVIDTAKKRISLKPDAAFEITPADIVKIKNQTRQIREYIIK